jgi:hypothetical protein
VSQRDSFFSSGLFGDSFFRRSLDGRFFSSLSLDFSHNVGRGLSGNFGVAGNLIGGNFSGNLSGYLGGNLSLDNLLHLGAKDGLLLGVHLERNLGFGQLDGVLGVFVALELAPVTRELEERGNLLGGLSANAEPVLSALRLDLDDRRVGGGHVAADFFDHAAIALRARVGNNDAVVRSTDFAHALQTNLDRHNSPECGKTG